MAVKISKFSSDQYLEESCSFSIVSEHLQHQIYVTKINNKSALNIYCLIGLKLILVPLVWFVYLYSNPLIVYFMLFLKGQFSFIYQFLSEEMSFLVHGCILIGIFYIYIKK